MSNVTPVAGGMSRERGRRVVTQTTPEVEVTVTPPAEETSPDVVVVETGDGDGGNSDATVDLAVTVGELTAAVQTLTQRVEEIDNRTRMTETTADLALEVAVEAEQEAETAEDVAVEAVEETAEEAAEETEELPPDEPPARKHWAHKSFRELIGGDA